MTISVYHQKYIERSDQELVRRALAKEKELTKILNATGFETESNPVRVAVLGCADRRFVQLHKNIFEKLLNKSVELTTFDITVEHLGNSSGVVQHDITLPLPNVPYDIAFGHVVLKFIDTKNQWEVINNSYNALRSPGLAIHVFDSEEVTAGEPRLPDGNFRVPLEEYEKRLEGQGIKYVELRWKIDLDEMPIPIRGIEGGALVLVK